MTLHRLNLWAIRTTDRLICGPLAAISRAILGSRDRVQTYTFQLPAGHDPARPQPIPLECANRWIGWTPDGLRIVAVGNTPQEVRELAKATGHPNVVFHKVGPYPR